MIESKIKPGLSKPLGDNKQEAPKHHKEGHDYSKVEAMVDGLEHPHETEHAMNHAAKRLAATPETPTEDEGNDMSDFDKLADRSSDVDYSNQTQDAG